MMQALGSVRCLWADNILDPLTAILGNFVVGAKTPAAFDYFQQQRDL